MTVADTLSIIPGVCLSAAIAFLALLASSLHPAFDALLIAPLMGMLLGNFIEKRGAFETGVRFCIRRVLPVGLGLYGAQMVIKGPAMQFLPHVLGASLLFFLITFLVSKGFGLEPDMSLLLCAGLSMSGASAIAIVSGARAADKNDVSVSLIALWTIGIAGMLLMSFCPDALGLAAQKYAFMLGAALPSLGMVKAASATMGENFIRLAASLKLVRTALMGFLIMALYFTKKAELTFLRASGAIWFILIFFGLALAVNLSGRAGFGLSSALAPAGLLLLSVSLAALGFTVEFESIAGGGAAPMLTAFFAWGISVLFIYLAMKAF